jgi:hypothetical protein
MHIHAQTPINFQDNFFEHLKSDARILSENGLLEGDINLKDFVTEFKSSYGIDFTYKKEISIAVNKQLSYEIGNIVAQNKLFAVMYLNAISEKNESSIEFLIIHEISETENNLSDLEKSRDTWMNFCNTHQVERLVSEVYHKDAYYYNRGRLLQGTKALSKEYS